MNTDEMFCPQVQHFTINTLKYTKFDWILVYWFLSPEAIRIKDYLNMYLQQTITMLGVFQLVCSHQNVKMILWIQKKMHLKDIHAQSMETQTTLPHLPSNTLQSTSVIYWNFYTYLVTVCLAPQICSTCSSSTKSQPTLFCLLHLLKPGN